MTHLTVVLLLITLVVLLLLASFFSATETSMMSLNRYRLRHLVKRGHAGAKRAQAFLHNPERMLGVVLIGNTCANIIASAIVTLLAQHYFGEMGVALATGLLTLVVLFFCEVLPKTLAAFWPEQVAYPATIPLKFFAKILAPLVWFINALVKGFTRLFHLHAPLNNENLSVDELSTLLRESGGSISDTHRQMLIQALELERLTVADIMIPRQDLVGLNLDDDLETLTEQILNSPYRRLPVYRNNWDEVLGILSIRDMATFFQKHENWCPDDLVPLLQPIYVIPETTPLTKQLTHFRRKKARIAFIVNEFGEIQGVVTLEDLLEEIVGEFTTDFTDASPDIKLQKNGSYLIAGYTSLREIKRCLHWSLPPTEAKTLSGFLIDHLQQIPAAGTSVRLDNWVIEVLQTFDNRIKMVRVKAINTQQIL